MSYRDAKRFSGIADIIEKLYQAQVRDRFANVTARFILNPIRQLSETLRLQDQTMQMATVPRYSDVTSYENNGTAIASPTFTTGKFARDGRTAKAVNFNGTSQYIEVADHSSLNFAAAESFSLSVWIKTDNAGAEKAAMAKVAGALATNAGYALQKKTNNKMAFQISDGTNAPESESNSVLNDNALHNVIGVRDVSLDKLLMYVDGVLQTSQPSDTTTATLTNTQKLLVAARGPVATPVNFWEDILAEPMLFRRAISAAEALLISKGGLISKDLVFFLPFYDNYVDSSGGLTGLEEVNA